MKYKLTGAVSLMISFVMIILVCYFVLEPEDHSARYHQHLEEPIPEKDPAWNTPGLLVTPHCSGKMTMAFTRDTLVDTFCENLKRFYNGQPMLHVVDKTLGY